MVNQPAKTVISPIQKWLLAKGCCVGCGQPLSRGEKRKYPTNGAFQVTCQCERVFVYHPEVKEYRRAMPEEVIV